MFTQLKDLGIPTLLVINMSDLMSQKGISLNIPLLEKKLETKIALVSTRNSEGLDELKKLIINYRQLPTQPLISLKSINETYFKYLEKTFPDQPLYKLWLVITQDNNYTKVERNNISNTSGFKTESPSSLKKLQQKETIKRYQYINGILKQGLKIDHKNAKDFRSRLDKIFIHSFWGYVIFFAILMIIFQSIFSWSTIPMDFIDRSFVNLSIILTENLAPGVFTDLLTEGIIPGVGGIAIFIPQIAFLFLFLSILEETGYMSRVVFLMDRGLRPFGLSGKSVVPLISGTACAIPAIMATRNIENWKERLITILVTPFMTCSARLPVYSILIALVIPVGSILGFSFKGLVLMLLYLSAFIMALVSSFLYSKILKVKFKSYFVVEMPNYKFPLIKNIALIVWEKTKSFVTEAGKIILAISVILWILASFGPGREFNEAENILKQNHPRLSQIELETKINSFKLENSYLGKMGKLIEPIISPLGYDWKIGIALISSFAAREVFVGTLATIYNVQSDKVETIKNKMASEIREDGKPVFNYATGISLMLFYAFAMQCMSTLAVVKKETNTWKWPMIQLFSMTLLAYIISLISYQILS